VSCALRARDRVIGWHIVGLSMFVACAHCEPSRVPSPARTATISEEAAGLQRCPKEMALVDDRVCVDRWEASLVEVTPSGDRDFSPYESPDGSVVRAVSRPGVVPQGYISRDQAEQACEASNKRLCTESEWMAACAGAPARTYPYGNVWEKGACNDSGFAPLQHLYGNSRSAYLQGPMNDPRLNQLTGTVAKTGEFPRCAGDLRIYDMVGNLHEWVKSPRATFRGGYYLDVHLNGPGCSYRTTAHAAAYHDYSTGFRCCAEPRAARASYTPPER
jgi:hypothetical protein